MKPRGWAFRGALALALFSCATSPGPVANPHPATRPPAEEQDGGGIGLGNFDAVLDAGPDAHWVHVDAAAFQGKKVNGRIPPERIQATVRASFAGIRTCYEQGLRASPSLQGRITIKFVIDLEGRVTSTVDAGSDLPDREIVQCVADAFKKLRFPKPEGGIVTVVYPLVFNPGD
jgi:hypothetical protein